MYNAATYLAYLRRHLEGVYSPESSGTYPDSELLAALNEAQRTIQDALGWIRTQAVVSTTAGVAACTLPPNLMGQRILEILVVDGNQRYPIDRRSYSDYLLFSSGDAQTGYPGYWALDESAPGQFLLHPAPSQAFSLLLNLEPIPTPLSRVFYKPASVVASGASGSTALNLYASDGTTAYTGSGETASNDFWAGLELGFCSTNSTTGLVEMPFTWHRVESADMTTGTLNLATALPYAVTGGNVLAGQVADFELSFPGRMGNLLPDLAAARLLQLPDPEKSSQIQQIAATALSNLRPDKPSSRAMHNTRPILFSRSRINRA